MFLEPPSCFLAHDEFGIAVKSARGRNETLAHVDVEDAFGAEARIVRVAPGVVGGGPVVVVAVSVPVKGVSLHVWDPVNLKMHHLAILDSRANKSISLLALAECDVVGSSLDGTYSWLAMQRDTGSKLALYRIRKKGGMPEYIVDEQPTRYDWCLPERVTCVSFCVSTSEEDRTYAGEPLIFFGTASGEVGALRLTSRGEVERVKELTGMKACDAVTAIAYDISQNGHIVLFVGSGAPKSRANLNIFTILASSMSLVVSQQCLYSTCNGRTESLSVMRGDSGYRIHCLCVGTRGCQAVTVRVCGSDVEVLGAEDWSGRFPDVTCVRFTGINGDLQVINDMACTFVHTAHPIERAVIPAEADFLEKIMNRVAFAVKTDTDAARHVFDKRRLGQELAFDAIAARVGATGPLMYPVKSGEEMQTLLGNFMRRGAGDEYTCGMVYYLLKDVENEWSSDFAHTVGMVEGFRRVLDGLWCLDHGDLETAVMYLNTPGATNPFQNAFKIMQALMHACEPELAAKYMKGSGAASLSVQDMRGYEMKILLEKGCLLEAFLFQREDSECGEFGLLGTLLQHTFNMNKSADLIHLPLTDAEEAQLVSFCQTHASQGHGICVNFLLKYYMARGRVAEAVYTYDAVPDADWNHDGVTDVIENLRMTLPGDQRELLRKAVKAPVEKFVQPEEVQAPVLISTMLDQCIGSVAKEDSVVGGDHTPVIAPADLRSSTPFSGLATGTSTPKIKDVLRVAGSPFKRPVTPTRGAENVLSVEDVMTANVRERERSHSLSRSSQRHTLVDSNGVAANTFLEKAKDQDSLAFKVIKSPVGVPTTTHAMSMVNMSPFSNRQSAIAPIDGFKSPEAPPAVSTVVPMEEYDEPITFTKSTRQLRKTPARVTRKSMAFLPASDIAPAAEDDDLPESILPPAPTPGYSLRMRGRQPAETLSTRIPAPSSVAKTAKTPKSKRASANNTPAFGKKGSVDDAMTLDEILVAETPKRGRAAAKSAAGVGKVHPGVEAETPRRTTRRTAKLNAE